MLLYSAPWGSLRFPISIALPKYGKSIRYGGKFGLVDFAAIELYIKDGPALGHGDRKGIKSRE
jgi:hypothetical protein